MEGWDKAVVDVVGAEHRQWSSLHPHFLPHPEFIPQKHINQNQNELTSYLLQFLTWMECCWKVGDGSPWMKYSASQAQVLPPQTTRLRAGDLAAVSTWFPSSARLWVQSRLRYTVPGLVCRLESNPAESRIWFPRAQRSFLFCDLTGIQINHQKPPLSSCYSLSLSVLENTSLPSSSSARVAFQLQQHPFS